MVSSMSEEPSVPLQEHLEHLIDDLRRETDAAFAGLRREIEIETEGSYHRYNAAQNAIDKAEREIREKLAVMNEFRGALVDQSTHFVRTEQFDALEKRVETCASRDEVAPLQERVSNVEAWKNNIQGRLWGVPMVIGVVVFVITQLMRVLFPGRP